MSKYAFVGGKLVDGTGAAVEDSLVLIDDDKITYAGPRKRGYEGTWRIWPYRNAWSC